MGSMNFERVRARSEILSGISDYSRELDFAGLGRMAERLEKISRMRGPILIEGPSGSGKTHLAGLVHQMSPRSDRVCLQHGCGDFDVATFPSTLFGHRAGTFTGASTDRDGLLHHADGGTLILDDIDYLDLPAQRRLLRFFDDGGFHRMGEPEAARNADILVIATTNKDLDALVRQGDFLSDLRYRIRRWRVQLAPIARRNGVVARAASRMFEVFVKEIDRKEARAMEDALLDAIEALPLNGNFRELREVVENVALLAEPDRSGVITVDAARRACAHLLTAAEKEAAPSPAHEDEDGVILAILKQTDWNISAASRVSGRSRNTIYSRIRANGWVRGRI